jgi:lipopolysaccharide/colanic/teichoic acid biosynthesis glycosyltransferase
MTDEKDEKGHFLPDEIRLTQVGKIIRKNSFDELLQDAHHRSTLFGEFSFVHCEVEKGDWS